MRSPSTLRQRLSWTLVVLGMALSAPSMAHAQAALQVLDSSPVQGAAVHTQPLHLRLHFNGRIANAECALVLQDPQGRLHTLQPQAQSASDQIVSSLQGFGAGAYVLRWQTNLPVGPNSQGSLSFTVE